MLSPPFMKFAKWRNNFASLPDFFHLFARPAARHHNFLPIPSYLLLPKAPRTGKGDEARKE